MQTWEVLAEVALYSEDDEASLGRLQLGDVSVSWRGDGQFFGTVAAQQGGQWGVRTWAREGAELHATGKPVTPHQRVSRPYMKPECYLRMARQQWSNDAFTHLTFIRLGLAS